MKLRNCSLAELFLNDKKIIVWGCGQAFAGIEHEMRRLQLPMKISYVVDKCGRTTFDIQEHTVNVYNPKVLEQENNCVVLVSSTKYMLDIYQELLEMSLPDTVECYFWSFVRSVQPEEEITNALRTLLKKTLDRAPRIIHTFWFSGDPLPEEYQKCLDSWKKYCPDYEIKIWNQETYDCGKQEFVKRAIEARKWAFAADVARLDVLYEYGGIYMDLDVEIYQPLDDLLGHKGVFFHLDNYIDMPVFASVKGNELLKKLMALYDGLEFSMDEEYQKNVLIQPRFVKPVFEAEGVPMEEGVHEVNGNLYLPRNMFLPYYWFDWSGKSKCGDAGYGIHHCNAGWFSDSSREERNANIAKVAALWNRIYEGKE